MLPDNICMLQVYLSATSQWKGRLLAFSLVILIVMLLGKAAISIEQLIEGVNTKPM